MTLAELHRRLSDDEDNYVERKPQSVKQSEIRRTATAFANQLATDETGVLFIGVADNGDALGVDNTDALQKRVRRALQHECYPPIKYTALILEKNGKKVLAVAIPASSSKPHFAGPAYVRIGSESVNASDDQYEQLIASRNEKCRRLQRLGQKTLSVVSHKKLGDTRRIPDGAYREYRECKIEFVDAHHVRLYDIGHSEYFSEPLSNIEIARDEKKHRPLLIVRQAR